MERRLAAILVADAAGYSRLMEADEEATARTLRACREIVDGLVADHRGRVFGSAGDSVVAEFLSPIEAVRCAVEIQRELETHKARFCCRSRAGPARVHDVRVRPGFRAPRRGRPGVPLASKPRSNLRGVERRLYHPLPPAGLDREGLYSRSGLEEYVAGCPILKGLA